MYHQVTFEALGNPLGGRNADKVYIMSVHHVNGVERHPATLPFWQFL